MKDFRKPQGAVTIDPALVRRGEIQLRSEIALLEQWIQTLDSSPKLDTNDLKTRQIYLGMLRSRKEMLQALQSQTKT